MGVCSNVSIIPMHSGYQDEQTLELKLKEHYERHYTEVLKQNPDISQLFNQFEIVIPVERIVSASLFEIDAFIHFLEMKISQLESKTRVHSQTYPAVSENISYG
ncbi:hypothetical protein C9927_02230 [Pseudidiomarina aestuarii]|nr:hypothetical protein C9927_02230 [Pseudidiomarina aestuarii]